MEELELVSTLFRLARSLVTGQLKKFIRPKGDRNPVLTPLLILFNLFYFWAYIIPSLVALKRLFFRGYLGCLFLLVSVRAGLSGRKHHWGNLLC